MIEEHRHCKDCGTVIYEERRHEGGRFPELCKVCIKKSGLNIKQ